MKISSEIEARERQFVHISFAHEFGAPEPPLPKQPSDGFPSNSYSKAPQTELRTLSQNCEQTLQRLRTNRITNKYGRFEKFASEVEISRESLSSSGSKAYRPLINCECKRRILVFVARPKLAPRNTLLRLSCHPTVTIRVSTARGVAGTSPRKNRSRNTGVSQLHLHQSCCTLPPRYVMFWWGGFGGTQTRTGPERAPKYQFFKTQIRNLGTTPILKKTLSEWKGHSRSNSRNSGAFSEQFSEWRSRPNLYENAILGATLGATLGIGLTPKFQPKFSERFFQIWGGSRAPDQKPCHFDTHPFWYPLGCCERHPNRYQFST